MGELIQLPTHKGSAETYGDIEPEKILKSAIDKKITNVIVLGWDGDEFYAASCKSNIGEALYMFEKAKQVLMQE